MKQHLEYISKGVSGYIVYKDNENQFRLYYEFGSGKCVMIIYLPQDWERETNTSLLDKAKILDFVCKQVIIDKAPNSSAEIVDNKWINIIKR